MIVGISPGTWNTGIAILSDTGLIDYRLKTFKGKWSKKKRTRILKTIEKLIAEYDVHCVAIKRTHTSHSSKNSNAVTESIIALCKQKGISQKSYTLAQLRNRLCKGEIKNSETVKESLLASFPELDVEFALAKSHNPGYYLKLFEAVAVAKVASKKIK